MNNIKDAILLERYKYVLEQKKRLDNRTFAIVAIFQTLMAGIFIGNFEILSRFGSKKLDEATAKVAVSALFFTSALISLIILSLILAGVASWIGYRNDESDLQNLTTGAGREPIGRYDFLVWYETYFVAGILAFFLGYFYYVFWIIYPIISAPANP